MNERLLPMFKRSRLAEPFDEFMSGHGLVPLFCIGVVQLSNGPFVEFLDHRVACLAIVRALQADRGVGRDARRTQSLACLARQTGFLLLLQGRLHLLVGRLTTVRTESQTGDADRMSVAVITTACLSSAVVFRDFHVGVAEVGRSRGSCSLSRSRGAVSGASHRGDSSDTIVVRCERKVR
jgi:hypothetical protein